MSVTLKILISNAEYKRLRSIESQWNALQSQKRSSSNLLDKGNGQVHSQADEQGLLGRDQTDQCVQNNEDHPLSEHISSTPISAFVNDKGDQRVPIEACENIVVDVEKKSKTHLELSDEVIVSRIRQRYQNRARKLLSKLKSQPTSVFNFDEFGILEINGEFLPGLSIFNALSDTFYQTKSLDLPGIEKWYQLLENLQLDNFLRKSAKSSPDVNHQPETAQSYKWYFLGKIGN